MRAEFPYGASLLLSVGYLHLYRLLPAAFSIKFEELIQGARGWLIYVFLANFGDHYSNGNAAEITLIDRVDASLKSPESDGTQHELECRAVRHIIDNVLAGHAAE